MAWVMQSWRVYENECIWTVGLCLWQAIVYGLASVKKHAE